MTTQKKIDSRTRKPEKIMLGGPRPRFEEFLRLMRISWEFLNGFRKLHFTGPCVTVFGSARFQQDNKWYHLARQVGAELGRRGFTVMTGGGPGLMEAANRGARDVGAPSVGCNIVLPMEQIENAYCDTTVWFRYFFVRKVMLVKYSYGFVVMPGGFGTLDEFFEAITLVQTKKIADFPIVLMGCEYWRGLFKFIDHQLIPAGAIEAVDTSLYRITDDPVEAADYITETARRRFGLKYGKKERRFWWLFE